MVFTLLTLGIAAALASRSVERLFPMESVLAVGLIAIVMLALLALGQAG